MGMEAINLQIDGKQVKAEKGMTILQAARGAGIGIPTICHTDNLEPYGACRLCMVEIEKGKRTKLVASCCYPAEEGLVVRTNTPKIAKIRKVLLELMLPYAPYGPLPDIAKVYKADPNRFKLEPGEEPSQCTLCGRCVRHCREIKKLNAIGFVGRGVGRKVELIPDIGNECITCRECYGKDVCESGRFVILAEAFPFLKFKAD